MTTIDDNLLGLLIAGPAFIALVLGTLVGMMVKTDEAEEPWWAGMVFVLWFLGGGVSAIFSIFCIVAGFKAGVS